MTSKNQVFDDRCSIMEVRLWTRNFPFIICSLFCQDDFLGILGC